MRTRSTWFDKLRGFFRSGAARPARGAGAIGRRYEDMAGEFLERFGYRIIERNFRCRGGEIDIVAEKDGSLRFVEVRGRGGEEFGAPIETIDRGKMRRLVKTARYYLHRRGMTGRNVSFDVVGISGAGGDEDLKLVEGAFDERVLGGREG